MLIKNYMDRLREAREELHSDAMLRIGWIARDTGGSKLDGLKYTTDPDIYHFIFKEDVSDYAARMDGFFDTKQLPAPIHLQCQICGSEMRVTTIGDHCHRQPGSVFGYLVCGDDASHMGTDRYLVTARMDMETFLRDAPMIAKL